MYTPSKLICQGNYNRFACLPATSFNIYTTKCMNNVLLQVGVVLEDLNL